jgi:excisionase family DNA binding protein
MEKLTLTAQEVADILNISIDTVYKLTRQNEIPHVTIGRRVLFRRESIEQWLKDNEESSRTYQ